MIYYLGSVKYTEINVGYYIFKLKVLVAIKKIS